MALRCYHLFQTNWAPSCSYICRHDETGHQISYCNLQSSLPLQFLRSVQGFLPGSASIPGFFLRMLKFYFLNKSHISIFWHKSAALGLRSKIYFVLISKCSEDRSERFFRRSCEAVKMISISDGCVSFHTCAKNIFITTCFFPL